jgi:cytochrome c oxidase cbb3-type subunit II
MVPVSIMPAYPWLDNREVDPEFIARLMRTHRFVGVPYTDEMLENAVADLRAQVDPDGPGASDLLERYPGAQVRNFGGRPGVTEMDALIAYLQVLGTMVDFSTFEPHRSR